MPIGLVSISIVRGIVRDLWSCIMRRGSYQTKRSPSSGIDIT